MRSRDTLVAFLCLAYYHWTSVFSYIIQDDNTARAAAKNNTNVDSLGDEYNLFDLRATEQEGWLDEMHTYTTIVRAMNYIAQSDITGSEASRDFSYAGTRDIRIHVNSYPESPPGRINRQYLIWGLFQAMGYYKDRNSAFECAFVCYYNLIPVGVISFVAANQAVVSNGMVTNTQNLTKLEKPEHGTRHELSVSLPPVIDLAKLQAIPHPRNDLVALSDPTRAYVTSSNETQTPSISDSNRMIRVDVVFDSRNLVHFRVMFFVFAAAFMKIATFDPTENVVAVGLRPQSSDVTIAFMPSDRREPPMMTYLILSLAIIRTMEQCVAQNKWLTFVSTVTMVEGRTYFGLGRLRVMMNLPVEE